MIDTAFPTDIAPPAPPLQGNIDTGFIPKHGGDLQTPPPHSKTRTFLSDLVKARKKSGSKAAV